MKRFVLMLLVVALLAMGSACAEVVIGSGSSGSEALKVGKEYEVLDACNFTVNFVEEFDEFFHSASGSAEEYIVVSFDLLNTRTEQFFLKTETGAKLVYDGDFEFEPAYLWMGPEGSYYRAEDDNYLRIFDHDADGNLFASDPKTINHGFADLYVKWNNSYHYVPENDAFIKDGDTDQNKWYVSVDPSKTVLDPLVERTAYYVFAVPEIVAEEEGLRELTLVIADYEYTLTF